MSATKIFVTQPIAPEVHAELTKLAQVEVFPDSSRIIGKDDLIKGVADADILYCLLHDKIDADVIKAGKKLKMIANSAIGVANIDREAATERGILLTGISNAVSEATADLELGLLLAVARRIVEGDKALRAGMFPGSQSSHFVGGEVHGKTLGTIGLGAIGQGVARRARGFDMKVLYTKRHRLPEDEEAALGVSFCTLDELLRASDYVCLNAALNAETKHLIGGRELDMMKTTAYLINTSRGPMVDEQALIGALREGKIAGAGLDVYEYEPKVADELKGMDNVVLTPHLGSAADDTRRTVHKIVLENITAFLDGKRPPNLFNPEVWES